MPGAATGLKVGRESAAQVEQPRVQPGRAAGGTALLRLQDAAGEGQPATTYVRCAGGRTRASNLPYRLRPGKVRAPKWKEARDPDRRPYELTDEQLHRVQQEDLERQRAWDDERRRVAEEVADDPEGPFKEYNAAIGLLKAEAPSSSHRETKAKLRALIRAHGLSSPTHISNCSPD